MYSSVLSICTINFISINKWCVFRVKCCEFMSCICLDMQQLTEFVTTLQKIESQWTFLSCHSTIMLCLLNNFLEVSLSLLVHCFFSLTLSNSSSQVHYPPAFLKKQLFISHLQFLLKTTVNSCFSWDSLDSLLLFIWL